MLYAVPTVIKGPLHKRVRQRARCWAAVTVGALTRRPSVTVALVRFVYCHRYQEAVRVEMWETPVGDVIRCEEGHELWV